MPAATITMFEVNKDRIIGRQYFMALEELPADATPDMLAGYEEAEAEYEDFVVVHKDRFNAMF